MHYLSNMQARAELIAKLDEIDALERELEGVRAHTDAAAPMEVRRLEDAIQEARSRFWWAYAEFILDDYKHHARRLVFRYLHPLRALGNKGVGAARLAAGAVEEIAAWEAGRKRSLWPTYDTCDLSGEAVSEEELLASLVNDLRADASGLSAVLHGGATAPEGEGVTGTRQAE
jgi:hypothetical protein